MNITVTGRHMEITEALKLYIDNGLGKLESHFDRAMEADVVLDVQKHRHTAEVNLRANGVRIHSKETSADMYASVDTVIEKLERQIRKFKDRINRHQPRRAKEARDYHHAILSLPPEPKENTPGEERLEHKVVLREKLTMEPMTVDEAIMQLELSNEHAFLVFSNVDTAQVNVVYSRDDGAYGLIEPQF